MARDARGRFCKAIGNNGANSGDYCGFKPGQSGNPSGRPPDTQEQKDAKALLKKAAPEAVELLLETMRDPVVRRDLRVRCAETVLDRVYGKATQPIDGSISLPRIDPDVMQQIERAVLSDT